MVTVEDKRVPVFKRLSKMGVTCDRDFASIKLLDAMMDNETIYCSRLYRSRHIEKHLPCRSGCQSTMVQNHTRLARKLIYTKAVNGP